MEKEGFGHDVRERRGEKGGRVLDGGTLWRLLREEDHVRYERGDV